MRFRLVNFLLLLLIYSCTPDPQRKVSELAPYAKCLEEHFGTSDITPGSFGRLKIEDYERCISADELEALDIDRVSWRSTFGVIEFGRNYGITRLRVYEYCYSPDCGLQSDSSSNWRNGGFEIHDLQRLNDEWVVYDILM